MASNTFRGTLRQLVDSDHNDNHQTFIDRVGQEFCLECACSQLYEPGRTTLHKTHICHCLHQIAVGCDDGGGTLAHCIIPAAVLSLASLGSNSPGSYTGSSGSESKLQNSLNELILDLQGSLTHSEMNAFLELVVQEISAGGCWPRRHLINLLARSVRYPCTDAVLATKSSGTAGMISSSSKTILTILCRRHAPFLNRLFGATLNCPQPEPLSDTLAVLDTAAASPFMSSNIDNSSNSIFNAESDSDAGEAARVCLAVLCSSDGDLDNDEKKTGVSSRAERLVRRLEKAGHNGCWISCMSALTHLARNRMKNIAAGISSSVVEDTDLEASTTDELLDSIVLGKNGGSAQVAASSKQDSSIVRIGVTGRSQLTRTDCPDATVTAAGLFEILATLRSRYARQLMRDGVAEFTVAGLGHLNKSVSGGAVALSLAHLLDALSTAEPIAFFHPSHFHPFALQALVEALTIQAGNSHTNKAPPMYKSLASQELGPMQSINKYSSTLFLNGQQHKPQVLTRKTVRMPAMSARTCAPLARVLRRASSHSTSGEHLGAPQLLASLAHVLHSAIDTAAAFQQISPHGQNSSACMDRSGIMDRHVNAGTSDIECLDLALMEILRTVETILTQVLQTALPSLQKISHQAMTTNSGDIELSKVVRSVLSALFKPESRLAERSDSVQAASLALAAAWAASSSSADCKDDDVLAWTAALVFGDGVSAVEAIISGRSDQRSAGPAATHALAVLVAILLEQNFDRLQQTPTSSTINARTPSMQKALAQHLCDSGYLFSLMAALAATAAQPHEDLHIKDQSTGTQEASGGYAPEALNTPDHHAPDTVLTVAFVAVVRQLIPPGIAMIDSVTALAEHVTNFCNVSSDIREGNTIAAIILHVIQNGIKDSSCIDVYGNGKANSSDSWPHSQSFQGKNDDDMFQHAGDNDVAAMEVAMLVLSMSPMDACPSTIGALVSFLCRHFIVEGAVDSHLTFSAAKDFIQTPAPELIRTGVHLLSAAARLNSTYDSEGDIEGNGAYFRCSNVSSSGGGRLIGGNVGLMMLPVDLSSAISNRLLPILARALTPIEHNERDTISEAPTEERFSQDSSILLALLARGDIPRLLLLLPPSPSLDEVLWHLVTRYVDEARNSTEVREGDVKTAASAAVVVRQLFGLCTGLDESQADQLAAALLREANRLRRDLTANILGRALGLAAELALPSTASEHFVAADVTEMSVPVPVQAHGSAYRCPLLRADLVAAAHTTAALALSDGGDCEDNLQSLKEFANGALRALASLAIRTAASSDSDMAASSASDLAVRKSRSWTSKATSRSDSLCPESLDSVFQQESLTDEAMTPMNYDPSRAFCRASYNQSSSNERSDCNSSNRESSLIGALVQCAPLLVMVACCPSIHSSSSADFISGDRYCSQTAALSALAAVAWAAFTDGQSSSLALLRTLYTTHGPAIASFLANNVSKSSQSKVAASVAMPQCAAAVAFLAATITGTTTAILQGSRVPHSMSRSPQYQIPSTDCPSPPLSVRTILAFIDPLHPTSTLSHSESTTQRNSFGVSSVSCSKAEQSGAAGAGLLASCLHLVTRLLLVNHALSRSSRDDGAVAASDGCVETDAINLGWWYCGTNERLRLRSTAHHHAISPTSAISEAACALLLALRATVTPPLTRPATASDAHIMELSGEKSGAATKIETAAGKAWCDEWHRVVLEELLRAFKVEAGTKSAMSNVSQVPSAVVRPGPFALLVLAATVQAASVVPWVWDAFFEQCEDDVPVDRAKEITLKSSSTKSDVSISGVIGGLLRAFKAECLDAATPGTSPESFAVQRCHLYLFCCLHRSRLLSDRAIKAIVSAIPASLRSGAGKIGNEINGKRKKRGSSANRSAGWWVLKDGLALPCELDCSAHIDVAELNHIGLGKTVVHPKQLHCATLTQTLVDASMSCTTANEAVSQQN